MKKVIKKKNINYNLVIFFIIIALFFSLINKDFRKGMKSVLKPMFETFALNEKEKEIIKIFNFKKKEERKTLPESNDNFKITKPNLDEKEIEYGKSD